MFRNKILPYFYDNLFYLEKGRFLYECNNYDKRLWDQICLGQHLTLYHIACSMCKKVIADGSSLSYHNEAVKNNLNKKTYYWRRKNPAWDFKKVKRFNTTILKDMTL